MVQTSAMEPQPVRTGVLVSTLQATRLFVFVKIAPTGQPVKAENCAPILGFQIRRSPSHIQESVLEISRLRFA